MVEPRDARFRQDYRTQRRLFLLRMVFLSLGIWSLCTLLCGIILSAICLQKGQTSYSVLAVVLTSLGMTGIITSVPCCLYFCLFHPRRNPQYPSEASTPDSPSLVSDLFLQFTNNHSNSSNSRGREEMGRRSPFSGSLILGIFHPVSRNSSHRNNSSLQSPPPYDPPPCYEDAATLRPLTELSPQHLPR